MKPLVLKFVQLTLHLIAIFVLALVFFPVAAHYLFSPDLLGIDTSHFLYYVTEFSHRLPLPPAGWKMTWFEGTPQFLDNPWLNFYLIQPLVKLYGALAATKIYLVLVHFIFILFSYLAFFELSGSIFLSLALAAAVTRSWATYIQLYSAGVALSAIAQIAFPASLYFLIKYLKQKSPRHLALAIIALSFGFYSHDGLTNFFILPSLLLFLFFVSDFPLKFFTKDKIKLLLLFLFGSLALSAIAFFPRLIDFIAGQKTRTALIIPLGQTGNIGVKDLIGSTHKSLFIFFPLSLILAPFLNLGKKIKFLLPLFVILGYFLFFQLTYELAINPFAGVIFPHRSFWLLPLLLAALIATLLSSPKNLAQTSLVWLFSLGLLISLFFPSLEPQEFKTTDSLAASLPSLFTSGLSQYKTANLFQDLKPEGFIASHIRLTDSSNPNYRIFAHNSSFRISWNMFSPLPQTHGYFHYSTAHSANWIAWLYATFSRENYEEGGIPENIALPQSLFLADWYATRYIAATSPALLDNVAPHFYQDQAYIKTKSSPSPPALIELSPDYVSPLARPTKAKVLGFIGDDKSYDYFLRNLAILNLNSTYAVPIRLADHLENVPSNQLAYFDALIFYNYSKKNTSQNYQAAWDRLGEYVNQGGNVFIESGADSPEKWGETTPALFPISQIATGSLGTIWQVKSDFFDTTDFDALSPLTYEGNTWNLTYAPAGSLKSGAKTLLSQKDQPLIVESSIGKGKIIWSGLNLFYRPLYHKTTAEREAEILNRLLQELVAPQKDQIEFDFARPKSEKVVLTFTGAHGALLKENNYGGWTATAHIDGKTLKLPLLSAGPDFIYAPLPPQYWKGPVQIEFRYAGTWYDWLFFVISLITLVFLLDTLLFSQALFKFTLSPLINYFKHAQTGVKKSWNQEEA